MSDSYKNNNINLKDLFHFALTKWKIFAVLAVFFVAAAAIYSYLLATPLYDSAGKIYIINKETLTSAEISASTYLTRDYTNLIADAAVLSDVSDKLGKKYSVSELKNAITVNNPENTRFIEISVRTASANDSKVIVDTVCTVAQEKSPSFGGRSRHHNPQGYGSGIAVGSEQNKKYYGGIFAFLLHICRNRFRCVLF